MAQLTLRLPDPLADDLRRAATARGQSVNAWVTAVLRAAVDPELAGDDAARTRERLQRAGLLIEVEPFRGQRPGPEAAARARRAAAQGKLLSDYVSDGRS